MKRLLSFTLSALVLVTACDKTPERVEPIQKEDPKPTPPNPGKTDEPKKPEEPKQAEVKVFGSGDFKEELIKDGVLTIPEEFTELGANALKGRSDFHTLVGIGIRKLGASSLAESSVRTLNLPKLQRIEDKGLQLCRQLVELSLPELEYLGSNALQECTALESLRIPKVKHIGAQALMITLSLRHLQLGSVLPAVGDRAFQYTSVAKKLEVAKGRERDFVSFANKYKFSAIQEGPALQANFTPFPGDTEVSGTDFVNYGSSNAKVSDFVLEPRYKTINRFAFSDRKHFHDGFSALGVERIEEEALSGSCDNLWFLDFPNVRTVGNRAFQGPSGRTVYINMPMVEHIGAGAFEQLYRLERVAFPRLRTIGTDAFAYCEALKELELGETLPQKQGRIFGPTHGSRTLPAGRVTLVVPKGKRAEYEAWRSGIPQIGRVVEKN